MLQSPVGLPFHDLPSPVREGDGRASGGGRACARGSCPRRAWSRTRPCTRRPASRRSRFPRRSAGPLFDDGTSNTNTDTLNSLWCEIETTTQRNVGPTTCAAVAGVCETSDVVPRGGQLASGGRTFEAELSALGEGGCRPLLLLGIECLRQQHTHAQSARIAHKQESHGELVLALTTASRSFTAVS